MTDPICGMTVEPERAAGSYVYNESNLLFLQPALPGEI